MNVPLITLNNGLKMPAFGLGTYLYKGGEAVEMIKRSIDMGYRHFDTAFLYNNESEIGEGICAKIAEGAVSRSDIFVAAKMWSTYNAPNMVEYGCRNSLENLGLDYIDLFIMHFPVSLYYENDEEIWPKDKNDDTLLHVTDIDYLETWQAMEHLVDIGLVKSIGVSNFNSEQILRLVDFARIKPVVNQVECCPTLNQQKLIEFCKRLEVIVIAYCPLRHPKLFAAPPPFLCSSDVQKVGEKYNKTQVQIALRFLVDLGAVPIPKSINEDHMRTNIDIFDFKLNDEEMALMHTFNTNERLVKSLDRLHSKYYPFHIEF